MASAFEEMAHGLDRLERFDCHPSWLWVQQHPEVPCIAVAVYLVVVFLGKIAIKEGKGLNLKHLFAAWNCLLGLFSTAGLAVCLPYLLLTTANKSVDELICKDELMWGSGEIGGKPAQITVNEHPMLELVFFAIDTFVHGDENEVPAVGPSCYGYMGYFMTAFMLSKFPELLDTVFLLVMGKHVSFLQWYHHATVLAYSWFAYSVATPTAMLFGTMNYGVHSVMYTYFFLSAYSRAFSFLRVYITTLQLMQMVAGVGITAYSYYLVHIKKVACSAAYSDMYFYCCFALYASYFVLFAHLFHSNYVAPKPKRKIKTE